MTEKRTERSRMKDEQIRVLQISQSTLDKCKVN